MSPRHLIRALPLLVALVVVVVIAIPHSHAQDAPAPAVTQPDAAAPMIAEGPPGRVALNGPWTLRSDALSRGQLRGWQNGGFVGARVTVPNAANAKRITGEAGIKSFKGTVGWYSTTFDVTSDGSYAIRFESVNHRASVYLDGRLLGKHTGLYAPFEYDVPLKAGTAHTLVVRADWRHPNQMKLDGFGRTWFNFGGIDREVTVRPLARSEITAPTVDTRLQPGGGAKVDVAMHLVNHDSAPRTLRPTGLLKDGDQTVPFAFPPVNLPGNATRVLTTTVDVPKPKLWSPGDPQLYDVGLEVPGESSYTFKTGLRQVAKDGNRILLNGKPVELRGASLHEDSPGVGDAQTPAQMDQVVADLKAIGANATRAQHPLNPALLERLDAAGIMVWMEVGPVDPPGNWTSKTPALRAAAKARSLQSVYQTQTHPSIIAWNLANEVGGNGHPGGQAGYIDQLARELHQRDPGRLVALDVWGAHPPKVAGPMYRHIDAIGDTNYIGWYEDISLRGAALRSAIRQHITHFQKVFSDKIVVVTEFGAESNSQNATHKPGGYDFQDDLLRDHIDTYRKVPGLSGMLVWNLRDFAVSPAFAGGSIHRQVPDIHLVRGLNQKGLFTYEGNKPKPAVAVVKSLFASG